MIAENKKDCCGCGACYNSCPRNAIQLKADEYGFIYPHIDSKKCIDCGICEKVCAYQNKDEIAEPMAAYAAVIKEDSLLEKSASGGAFAAIAKAVILKDGVVFGCSMEKENGKLEPMHIKVDKISDLCKLQGSKYVQSDMRDSYKIAKKELESNRLVLFSGTPCQIAGLKGFLREKEYPNLLTIDLICHGVPNVSLFQDYVNYIEKKLHGEIISFLFRDKEKGWGLKPKVIYLDKKGNKRHSVLPYEMRSYYELFLNSDIYRENCYSCKYASKHRAGDLTIGDYWGIAKEHPEYLKANGGNIEEKKGVSCIIVNNGQGELLLEELGKGINLKKTDFEKVAKWNKQLNNPSRHSEKRNIILSAYKENGWKGAEKAYRKSIGLRYYVRIIRERLKNRF